MTHTVCHACYIASTEPRWVAQVVASIVRDTPCARHRPAADPLTVSHLVTSPVGAYLIVGNPVVDRGVIVYRPTSSGKIDPVAYAHPLEVLAMKHDGDPIAQSEAVAKYLTARAHRELDNLISRIGFSA